MRALKPCLFCGSKAMEHKDEHGYLWVECTSCLSKTQMHVQENDANREWNRRYCDIPTARDLLKELMRYAEEHNDDELPIVYAYTHCRDWLEEQGAK